MTFSLIFNDLKKNEKSIFTIIHCELQSEDLEVHKWFGLITNWEKLSENTNCTNCTGILLQIAMHVHFYNVCVRPSTKMFFSTIGEFFKTENPK